MVNIIKQEIVIEESLKKKKEIVIEESLKKKKENFLNPEEFLIYLIKKKSINL